MTMKTTRNDSRSDVTTIGIPRAETPFDATEIGVLREKTRSDATVNATLRQKVRISATEIGRRPIAEARNSYNFEKNFSIILSEATKR
jgi:hypothetical protein